MLYYKNLLVIIVTGLFIIGCHGDDSFDEVAFYDIAPPSSGESITPPWSEGGHGAYSSTNWMNAPHFWSLNPSLASITLPGTHDSGTSNYGAGWAPTSKCQEVNINKQLKWGVRFLDLRVSVDKKGVPGIYHDKAGYANRTLEAVLHGVAVFLGENSSECVVLCFKTEYAGTAQKSIRAIEDLLNKYESFVYDKSEVPRLKDVRGKMLYWRRYNSETGRGLKVEFPKYGEVELYKGAYLHCQDYYECTGEKKYRYIMNSFDYARKNAGIAEDRLLLCVSFTSYYNVIPAPWSDGPKMNKRVYSDIVARQRGNGNLPINLGVIASDYVSDKYVNTVLCTNFKTNY